MKDELKVVVTDYDFPDLRFEEKVLADLPNIKLVKGKARTEEEVLELVKDADAIINQYAPLNSYVLEQLEKCKVISRYGVGVNTVDMNKATEKGIFVTNVPDYCMDEVSDHALSLLLAWSRKIVSLDSYVKEGVWDFKKGAPIYRSSSQTVGVLGFGRIPRKLVYKLNAIGFNVLVHDPYVNEEEIKKEKAIPVTIEEVFRKSDYISVHMPLNDETEGIINKDLLNMAKKSLVIINTSRGPIINEGDLVVALETGRITGAALDVVEEEPISAENPLLKMNNVILTPHAAWYSEESQEELRTKCARNVLEVLSGQNPTYLVNKELITI